jgi:hypothetical protein
MGFCNDFHNVVNFHFQSFEVECEGQEIYNDAQPTFGGQPQYGGQQNGDRTRRTTTITLPSRTQPTPGFNDPYRPLPPSYPDPYANPNYNPYSDPMYDPRYDPQHQSCRQSGNCFVKVVQEKKTENRLS